MVYWWVQGYFAPLAAATVAAWLECNTLDVQHPSLLCVLYVVITSGTFAAKLAPSLCCGCHAFGCVELTTCCKAQTEPVLPLRGGIRLPSCWWSAVHVEHVHVFLQLLSQTWMLHDLHETGQGSEATLPGQDFEGHSQFNCTAWSAWSSAEARYFFGPMATTGSRDQMYFVLHQLLLLYVRIMRTSAGEKCAYTFAFAMDFLLEQRVSYGFAMICLNKVESWFSILFFSFTRFFWARTHWFKVPVQTMCQEDPPGRKHNGKFIWAK